MLKRVQILLTDWQIEYAKFIAEKYDISISEAVRMNMSYGIFNCVKDIYPDQKSKFNVGDVVKNIKKAASGKMKREALLQSLSKCYFDARKAAEYRIDKERNVDQVKKR